jgi:hypothetical protein
MSSADSLKNSVNKKSCTFNLPMHMKLSTTGLLKRGFRHLLPSKSFLVLLLSFPLFALSQSGYVKKYKPLADSLSLEFGIPASVILGVAILESGSGTSRNAKLLKNHFGIVGKNNLAKTKGIKTKYKQYPNVQSSYRDFARLMMKKKFYALLKGNMNEGLWIDAISKASYSEVPGIWKKRVLTTIKANHLQLHTGN